MLTLFSQVLVNINVPMPAFRKGVGLQIRMFPLFKLFPVLLTITIMWGLCGLLTLIEVFPEGHPARTDSRLKVFSDASWFRVPYPGQFGIPTVTLAGVLGMLAGVLACTVESISYYPTLSRMCNAGAIPKHALNRGIAVEGIGTALAGLWGSGNGTNTFGENVGAIGITKVGSRRVIQWAAGIMIVQGVISKLGAIFIMIPDPVVGGLFCVMFGMIAAFGLSALQYVDLKSARNLYILGVSLFFPMVLCNWMQKNPGAIRTGNETVDSTLSVLLGTSILVGGIIGCVLDHVIPGTDKERGLVAWEDELQFDRVVEEQKEDETVEQVYSTYDFPCGMSWLRSCKWAERLPFSPTYKERAKKKN